MMATVESARYGGMRAVGWQHRQENPDHAVAAELQQHSGEQHRADRRRLGVAIAQRDVQRHSGGSPPGPSAISTAASRAIR